MTPIDDEYWSLEPPWLEDLPASYAAYFRQCSPEGGRPRWRDQGIPQTAVLAAILREMRSGRVLVNAVELTVEMVEAGVGELLSFYSDELHASADAVVRSIYRAMREAAVRSRVLECE